MISLTLTPLSPSSSTLLSLKKPPISPLNLKPLYHTTHKILLTRRKKVIKRGMCVASLSHDAPFVIAIGSSILSSLVLSSPSKEDDPDVVLDSTDTRFAAMGIISFIPYFNWLSWVFAWLDTGKRRYAVYSVVYFLPYLRSNLSLAPEESWLPIASIISCIFHVQLEASIRNGDIQGFDFFSKAEKHLSSMFKKNKNQFEGLQEILKQVRKREDMNLPSAGKPSRSETEWPRVPEKPSKDQEQLNGDSDDNRREH